MRPKNLFAALAAASIVHAFVARPTPAGGAPGSERPGEVPVNTVVVVKNLNSADSVAVADYYARKRKLPVENVCAVRITDVEECNYQEYAEQLMGPLKQFLARLNRPIDYIVLTKGIPIRVREGFGGGLSVDSLVATMDKPEFPGFPGGVEPGDRANPYFGVAERFSHAKWGIYLVTRLIGYTRADCLRLVDNSLAARRRDGPFLLHTGPGHNDEGFKTINEGMRRANEILTSRHLAGTLSTGDEFPGNRKDLMGYYSWGSNDLKFKKRAYNTLGFAPGGIAETAVSTSARTFADPKAPWQSLIADLVAQGVTGCKGYVSEPGTMAMARADILFDRYTAGFNLAESFYSASWRIHCKDMVIGDPICAPYSDEQAAHAAEAPRPATLHDPGSSSRGGTVPAPDGRADEAGRRPRLLIIGASSLNSPLGQTQLVGAMLESRGIRMDVEGTSPQPDEVGRMLSSGRAWDYVIMDAWHLGRGPNEFGKADVPSGFPKAVADFVKHVRAHSPGCAIILFTWWVPRGPKATNEGVMEVFRGCAEQAERNDIWVATTGPAFMEAHRERPGLRVTKSDTDAHPGIHGAYINACSLFEIISGQSPVGLPATLRLPGGKEDFAVAPDDATYLQELSWKVYQREIKKVKPAK